MNPDFSISFSELNEFAKSPAHLIRYREEQKQPTPAMIFGRAAHAVILDQPLEDYVVTKIDRRTKEGKAEAERVEAAGLTVISPDDHAEILQMREVFRQLTNGWGEFQREIYFRQDFKGFQIRGRRDIQHPDFIADLKIMADASPRAVRNACLYDGLAMQGAIYTAEWDYFRPYKIVAIERKTLVGAVYTISPDTMRSGVNRLEYLMDRYASWVMAGQPVTGYNFWEGEV
jgi:hypothetical protein